MKVNLKNISNTDSCLFCLELLDITRLPDKLKDYPACENCYNSYHNKDDFKAEAKSRAMERDGGF